MKSFIFVVYSAVMCDFSFVILNVIVSPSKYLPIFFCQILRENIMRYV